MYYPELSSLTDEYKLARREIEELDRYLASLSSHASENIFASMVLKHVSGDPSVVRRLLERCVDRGFLSKRYRVLCPLDKADIDDFDSLTEIPQEIECRFCDDTHQVGEDDIVEVFVLQGQAPKEVAVKESAAPRSKEASVSSELPEKPLGAPGEVEASHRRSTTKKLGLALSGGGYRAAAFHLGVMEELYDRGLLQDLDVISGVSGGSIVAALYGLTDTFPEFRRRLLHCLKSVTLVKASDILRGFLNPLSRRFARLQGACDKHLFGKRKLSDLRTKPSIFISATDLGAGLTWFFAPNSSGHYVMGLHDPDSTRETLESKLRTFGYPGAGDIRISTAVAASSAVPGVFNPKVLKSRSISERLGRARVVLVDGGVYDNLGVLPLVGVNCRRVILSDGSSPFFDELNQCTHLLGVLNRTIELLGSKASNQFHLDRAEAALSLVGGRLTRLPITYEHDGLPPDVLESCYSEKTRLQPSDTIESLIEHGRIVARQLLP